MIQHQFDFASRQAFLQTRQLDIDNAPHIVAPQTVKDDDFIQTVQEFGPEMRTNCIHHIAFGIGTVGPFGQLAKCLRAQIRCQNDDGLFEIDSAPLAIGQNTIIQNLQQHVEHIWMRLFDFVKQHHLIGAAAHGLGQDPAFVIADIAGGCTDQTRDRMFFHEFGHINAHHGAVIVKQKRCHRFGQFGFANTRWTKEQERPQWPTFVV